MDLEKTKMNFYSRTLRAPKLMLINAIPIPETAFFFSFFFLFFFF